MDRLDRFRYMRLAGFTGQEHMLFGLDSADREQARRYLSSAQLHNVVAPALNDWRYRILLEDKWLFARMCDHHGIPGPRTLGLIDPRVGTTWEGEPLRSAGDLAAVLRRSGATRIVIKPLAGRHSEQILFAAIERGDELRVRVEGRSRSIGELLSSLDSGGFHGIGGHLLQEALEPHPAIAEVNPDALNAIRAHTLRRADGSVAILDVTVRFGRCGREIEVLDEGGVLAEVVDLGRGVLGEGMIRPWLPEAGRYRAHPDTGAELVGRELPHWQEFLGRCREVAQAFPELRLIGWDLAITTDGVRVIEGNPDWSPRPGQSHGRGMLTDEVLKELERLGVPSAHSEPTLRMAGRRLRRRLGRKAVAAAYRLSRLDPYADRLR
jgi:hypothetical protein